MILRLPKQAKRMPNYVFAVIVLTSMDEQDFTRNWGRPPGEQVARLASIALDAGCAGVVSSAREVQARADRRNFLVVTPGVRPLIAHYDQARGNHAG
jgi:orotidine-5'-phosphate decarboxylase